MGNLSLSLKAGTTIVKSTRPGSARGVNCRGFLGDACDLYFFSEGYVIMGGGDQKMRAR